MFVSNVECSIYFNMQTNNDEIEGGFLFGKYAAIIYFFVFSAEITKLCRVFLTYAFVNSSPWK